MSRYLKFNLVQNVFGKQNLDKKEELFVAPPSLKFFIKFQKIFLKSKLSTRFKHNLGLHKRRMRFKLFYSFIFCYWFVLIAGPFIN